MQAAAAAAATGGQPIKEAKQLSGLFWTECVQKALWLYSNAYNSFCYLNKHLFDNSPDVVC